MPNVNANANAKDNAKANANAKVNANANANANANPNANANVPMPRAFAFLFGCRHSTNPLRVAFARVWFAPAPAPAGTSEVGFLHRHDPSFGRSFEKRTTTGRTNTNAHYTC